MAQVLKFKPAPGDKALEQYRQLALVPVPELETSFWPEVSNRVSSERPNTVNPENSLSRILFEMACILAGAGALVAAVSLFVQAPVLR